MLLLLLSRSSCVRLCATPWMAAHQAPPSLGFSRQEYWSGLPFPSPVRESEFEQSGSTLPDPIDCSLPGSSDHVHGIFQARVLEWVAIAFSICTAGPFHIQRSVCLPNCRMKIFWEKKKKDFRRFLKVKLEFALCWQLFA